jgi:hypothetical protein
MERRVGVMADPEQEDLPVEVVDAADRASRDVRRERERIGGDPRRRGPEGRAGEGMVAPQRAGPSPERLGHGAEIGRGRGDPRIEGSLVVARPGRHDQRAVRPQGLEKGVDQAMGAARDRPHGPEGGVHEQDAAPRDPEGAELCHHLVPWHLAPIGPARHAFPRLGAVACPGPRSCRP